MYQEIILGPPGTGKTTKLIAKIKHYLGAEKIPPQEIGFVSFTRKAIIHATDIVTKEFKLTKEKLPWFRTLHSLSFHFHHMEASTVLGWMDYTSICKSLGLTMSSVKIEADGYVNYMHTKGDRLFFLENYARSTGKTIYQAWKDHPNDDMDLRELELLKGTIERYKEAQGKMDFTDMIIHFNQQKKAPPLQVLIVDEAQDLSPIQWSMVDILKKDTRACVLAGDDDQAIFSWAGADVKMFQQQLGKVEVLSQSYRIPQKVHAIANRISSRISKRTSKPYEPTPEVGKVEYVSDISHVDMSKGTWLLLARNIYLLGELDAYCINRGYYFESKYGSAIDHQIGTAIKYWELLRAGEKIQVSMAKLVYEYLPTKQAVVWGSKKVLDRLPDDNLIEISELAAKYGLLTNADWRTALTRIPAKDRNYFSTVIKNGEKLLQEPRIKINTIHGVKGGEAENVLLISDMSVRTWNEYQMHPDEETRVWYVGVTRTKQSLYIVQPRTQYFFQI